MRSAVTNKRSAISMASIAFGLFLIACCLSSCSIPNMQSQQCSEASDSVKEFYSWYLGTDAQQRQPEIFRKFLTSALLTDRNGGEKDPFYLSATAPTTFKIGKCELVDDSHANVQVQLYWRHSDQNTEQRELYADTVKNGDTWQIAKIEDR